MAFDASNMALIADGNDKKLYFYSSAADALAAITASGYFDAFHAQLGVGDVILIQDSANVVTTRRVSASSSTAVVLAAMDDQKVHLDVTIPDISTAGQIYTVAPVAGTVSRIWSVIDGAITIADATLTAKINGTAVTGATV